jgi:four helix bundle protein
MGYHEVLKIKIHQYIKFVYFVTNSFPRNELYGVTSQLRRAAISIMLNYVEGYARRRGENCKVYKNFLETSYGSLKESEYLVYFSYTESYIKGDDYSNLSKMADEIGAMIWKTINRN